MFSGVNRSNGGPSVGGGSSTSSNAGESSLTRAQSIYNAASPAASSSTSNISSNSSSNSGLPSSMPLPFFKYVSIPHAGPEVPPGSVPEESCAGKIVSGAVLGGVLGVGMGVFMGMMNDPSPIQVIKGREVPQAPLREQMRVAYRSMASRSYGWAKSFAVLTALFGGIECVIEKYRAKHDVWNPVISGCAVGATLSAKSGPVAACAGCAGFAGFSFLVDKIMGH